jgi:hypothetical protein
MSAFKTQRERTYDSCGIKAAMQTVFPGDNRTHDHILSNFSGGCGHNPQMVILQSAPVKGAATKKTTTPDDLR